MFYIDTPIKSKMVMQYRIVTKEFGLNIQHIYRVDNIVSNMISNMPTAKDDYDYPNTNRYQFNTNKLFQLVSNTPVILYFP